MGVIFALAQSLVWAGTSILLRSLSTRMDAFLLNGIRATFGLLVIIPLVWITGGAGDYQLLTVTRLVYLIGSVIVGGVFGDAFYIFSLKTLGVGRAFPITNSFPVFTVLFSFLFLHTPISWQTIGGMTLVLLGVYLVARPRKTVHQMQDSPLSQRQWIIGVAEATLTAASWGLATVVFSMGIQGMNGITATSVRIPFVALLSLAVAGQRGQLGQIRHLDRRIRWQLVLTGVLGWGVSAALYVAALQLAGPNKTAIIGASAPLFAVPLSVIFLHERISRATLVGTVLSVIGILFIV